MATVVYYSGMVQGVGFRATTASLARGYTIRGWVRNLSDGRVELVVDGPSDAVSRYLAHIRNIMAEYISNEQTEERETEVPEGFRIVG